MIFDIPDNSGSVTLLYEGAPLNMTAWGNARVQKLLTYARKAKRYLLAQNIPDPLPRGRGAYNR